MWVFTTVFLFSLVHELDGALGMSCSWALKKEVTQPAPVCFAEAGPYIVRNMREVQGRWEGLRSKAVEHCLAELQALVACVAQCWGSSSSMLATARMFPSGWMSNLHHHSYSSDHQISNPQTDSAKKTLNTLKR